MNSPNPTNVPSWKGRWQRFVRWQPLPFVLAACVIGILIDSSLPFQSSTRHYFWLSLLLSSAVALFATRSAKRFTGVATMTLMLAIGAFNHLWQDERYENAPIFAALSHTPRAAILEGQVDRPVVLRRHPLAEQRERRGQSTWQTRIEMKVAQSQVGRDLLPTDGRVLVNVDGRRDQLKPGDSVRVYGTLRKSGPPTNPGQRSRIEIDRRNRLHGRIEVDQADQVVLLSGDALSHAPYRAIAWIAGRGRDILLEQLSSQTGPLAVALVIGQRDFVDLETSDQLLTTGTAHLLSVSGMHLAIVVTLAALTAMLLRFPPAARIVFVLSVCLFYTALTGGRPPVVRAAVLVATFLTAMWMRRPAQPINTLSFAGLLLVMWNPESVFSVGVQLSFLAVATLILCDSQSTSGTLAIEQANRREEALQKLSDSSRSLPVYCLRWLGKTVWKLIWFSGCVTAMSLPLVWHQFNVVSPISVLTNVLLGPFLFIALASGIGTVGGGLIWQPLAVVPAAICNLSLISMRGIISWAANIPAGHFWLPAPPSWWVIAFYVIIGISMLPAGSVHMRRLRYSWIVLWIAIAVCLATRKTSLENDTLEATFVDVGHGTSVVLRLDQDDVWLYDCGRLGNDSGSSRDIDQAIWSLGITHLNGVFLSHADADHFNALPGLLRRFSVDQILTPPGMIEETEPALDDIRRAIIRHGVPVFEVADGDVIETSNRQIRILHPPRQRLPASDNANSLVLRIDCGGKPLLLPGDLEPPGTDVLIRHDRPPPGAVLMAPHHGSLQMDAASVLQWARPLETVVSGGGRARRPEVREMLSEFGGGVHVTAEVGAIRVRIDDKGRIDINSWIDSPW